MRDGRVLGGILKTFRRLLKDGVLGQEIARQNLLHFAFQCLDLDFDHDFDVHPDPTQFHELITDTIYDLSWAAAEYKTIFDQAFEGTAKIARALHRCTDDPEILLTQLKILQRYLSKLNAFKVLNQEPLPSSTLQSLELPMLTRKLMQLVDNPSAPELLWESFEFIAEIFSWIAYYQSGAILEIPDNEGVSLLAAFMLSSSMPIRASGVMGLLNLYHNDTAQEIRLCNPQHILHLGKIETPDQLILKLTPPPLFLRCMSKFIRAELGDNPLRKSESDETTTLPNAFDPYETALRVVDFELNGPRSSDESFVYPKVRILGDAEHTPEVWDAMEAALKSHDKEYEADILNFSFLLLSRRILRFDVSDGGAINVLNATIQGAARICIKRWPDSCYFHYAWLQSQIGAEYVVRVDEQVDRPSCTPYLRFKFAFEAALNVFSMGIVRLCVDADAVRFRSQLFGEEYMKEADERIATAFAIWGPGSADEKILEILSCLTTIVNKCPSAASGDLKSLRNKLRNAVHCLFNNHYSEHEALIRLAAAFCLYYEAGSKRWTSFIDAVKNAQPLALQERNIGLLFEKLRLCDKDERMADDYKVPQYILEAVGYRQQHRCTNCGRGSIGLRRCKGCGKAKYCDKEWYVYVVLASKAVADRSLSVRNVIGRPGTKLNAFPL
ncbi:hypothetical protein SISSUDRAFT_405595 [Sistotremastrum suecicum HHB10207 ss-3]|uniref:MYND-type domain-containing protein n=1 Tax=Sistotremastrum suecicum HHB10207 ss-3 TaxID=1314776 RepID=A0A165YRJ7_9AGAM|nr:hypothetical protein SISSUDRAFT_405595 [Sistotremastrum suecicum HHB10207 ss-3]